MGLGHIYLQQGQYTAAIREYEGVIKDFPNYEGGYIWLAQSYEAVGDLADALIYYQKAYTLKPDNNHILEAIQRVESLLSTP